MNIRNLLAVAGTALAFFAGSTLAADKAEKQAEVRKATAAAIDKFYKAEPKIKGEVEKAPGYAVFTSYGMSFVVGGAGGTGLAHEKASGRETFMHMAQASAGVQAGISQEEVLLVFKSAKALRSFIDKGWDASAGGAASAGAKNKSAGGGTGETLDAIYYTLTKNGLQLGANVAGTKFWKDKDLN